MNTAAEWIGTAGISERDVALFWPQHHTGLSCGAIRGQFGALWVIQSVSCSRFQRACRIFSLLRRRAGDEMPGSKNCHI